MLSDRLPCHSVIKPSLPPSRISSPAQGLSIILYHEEKISFSAGGPQRIVTPAILHILSSREISYSKIRWSRTMKYLNQPRHLFTYFPTCPSSTAATDFIFLKKKKLHCTCKLTYPYAYKYDQHTSLSPTKNFHISDITSSLRLID